MLTGPDYQLPNPDHLDPDRKHAYVFAHQDDELGSGGTIARTAWKHGNFLWVTNGDGLAPMEGVDPQAYSAVRMAEAKLSAGHCGIPPERISDLEVSEIEWYRSFSHVAEGGVRREDALKFSRDVYDRVHSWLEQTEPDVVWTGAWQCQHPEHDLTHFFVAHALKDLRRKWRRPVPLYEFPEYEFVILVPLRFKPWHKGVVHRVRLTDADVANKMLLYAAYPSQAALFDKFERVIRRLGLAAGLVGRSFSIEEFMRHEEFGPVPEDRDFRADRHLHPFLDYMLDDFEGIPISFRTMIRPIVEDIETRRPVTG